jgi:hydrogenase nickel incorporation protein HypB
MCVTCGCSEGAEVTLDYLGTKEDPAEHRHVLADGTVITHTHDHAETHEHNNIAESGDKSVTTTVLSSPLNPPILVDFENSVPPKVGELGGLKHTHLEGFQNSVPPKVGGLGGRKHILEQNLLAKNDQLAAKNRAWFQEQEILGLNLVSSPGSGKTTLLTRTIRDLQQQIPISVIEGDQATSNDAQRIRETGCNVVQINTGTGCHLEAAMIQKGLDELAPTPRSMVMIENVGNLVCPALFDLGEQAKVVILSVTEGEDKPMKYPHMFRASQVMILNKIDLLPYVEFDRDRCVEYALKVNPNLAIFQVSATTGEGLEDWYDWLKNTMRSLVKS